MMANNLAGFENIPQTIPHFCFESFRRHNKPDALAYKIESTWKYINAEAAIERIKRMAFERALFAADLIGYGQAQAAGRRAVDREGQGGDLAAVPPINIHATLQMPEQAPQPIAVTLEAPPAPAIQIDVHVPEAPAPVVNLAAPEITVTPEITVKAFPERAVQTVERDEAGEIVRTITAYEDGA